MFVVSTEREVEATELRQADSKGGRNLKSFTWLI